MKKLISLCTLSTVFILAACNKSDNANPSNNNSNNNNTNTSTDFNWSGTPPLSVKVDGVDFVPDLTDTANVQVFDFAGYTNLMVTDKNNVTIAVSVQSNATANTEYTMPSPDNISYTHDTPDTTYVLQAKTGKYKIITNNATTLEGLFTATLYDPTNTIKDTKTLTNGYFKITKK